MHATETGRRATLMAFLAAGRWSLLLLMLLFLMLPDMFRFSIAHAQGLAQLPGANAMAISGYIWSKENTKQTVYIDRNGAVQHVFVGKDGRWHVDNLTRLTGAPISNQYSLAAFDWSANRTQQVVYVDNEWHLQELSSGADGKWQRVDLQRTLGRAPVSGFSIAGYIWSKTNSKNIAYVDEHGHVQLLYTGVNGPWHHLDLTRMTKAPSAQDSMIVASDWLAGATQQIAYIDAHGHVQELFSVEPGKWQVVDLTERTHAPLAGNRTLAAYTWIRGKMKNVAYIDRKGHVQELSTRIGHPWTRTDITAAAGAPPIETTITTLYGFGWLTGNAKQVAYTDIDGHIYELSFALGDSWHYTDLMVVTSAPTAAPIALSGYDWIKGKAKQFVYVDKAGNINEISIRLRGTWQYTSLTRMM